MSSNFWPFRKKSIVEDTFGFDGLAELKHQMENTEGGEMLSPTDYSRIVEGKIKCLSQRLVADIDHPSWGPKGTRRAHEKAQERELGQFKDQDYPLVAGQFAADEDPESLIRISQNLDQSERYYGFSWLYLGAIVVGLIVTAGALFVDYQIMNEFWTRVLANEFMEVPPDLANSVISKSAQVIFATMAFHFFLSRFEWGRTAFITVFFFATAIMIAGFGFLNANISMPSNPETITAPDADDAPSLDDALVALGLAEPTEAVVATPAVAEMAAPRESRFIEVGYFIEDARPFLWMFVPGMVFVVVTAIGALCLQMAENNIQNFVKSLDFPKRNARVAELNELRRYRAAINNMDGVQPVSLDEWRKGAA